MCDVASMETGHILLGHPQQFDRRVSHDGFINKYSFLMNKKSIVFMSLSPKEVVEEQKNLKQEFEKRLKEKVKEPQKSEKSEASVATSSSEKKEKETKLTLSVPE